MIITTALLRAATGCTSGRAALFAPHLSDACEAYRIDTPQRLACFLGQITIESGALRYVREIADGSAYEGREDLGNTEPGDGPRYRGRGLIQITGRRNYRAMTTLLSGRGGPDFEAAPEAAEDHKWAAWTAACWWAAHGCNDLADQGDVIGISRLINRGNAQSRQPANHEAERTAATDRARQALVLHWVADERLAATAPPPPQTPASAPPVASVGHSEEPRIMPIPAFIGAALPLLVEAIPKLGKLFGSGSQVAERNVRAAELVADAVQRATAQPTIQGAVEAMRADPAMLQAATRAVDSIWYDITEAGGGGIDGARRADAQGRAAGDLLHSASFWVALLLLPLVYLLVMSLIGLVGTATWSDDVRAGLAGSLISAIVGGLVGYYYGQTTTRNRSATA